MSIKQKINRFFTRKTPEAVSAVPAIPTGSFNIAGVDCQVKDGLVNLTDLWKAAKGTDRNRPKVWLTTHGVSQFIQALAKGQDSALLVKVKTGKGGGTFGHWQVFLAYAKWLSPELHIKANEIFMGWFSADPEMALDMLERIKNVEDVKRIEYRARNIVTNVELNDTIHGCGGTGYIYAKVADMNNVAITGKKAKQIRKENNLPKKASTRPLLSNEQMVHMAFLEMVEKQALIKKKVKGNEAIYNTCQTAKDSIDTVLALNS